MTINDPKLRAHVERIVAAVSDTPQELRFVCGLLDAFDFCSRTVGPESPEAIEALRLLTAAELRPGLRQWYQASGDKMNPAALQFRERLSSLIGERLGL